MTTDVSDDTGSTETSPPPEQAANIMASIRNPREVRTVGSLRKGRCTPRDSPGVTTRAPMSAATHSVAGLGKYGEHCPRCRETASARKSLRPPERPALLCASSTLPTRGGSPRVAASASWGSGDIAVERDRAPGTALEHAARHRREAAVARGCRSRTARVARGICGANRAQLRSSSTSERATCARVSTVLSARAANRRARPCRARHATLLTVRII